MATNQPIARKHIIRDEVLRSRARAEAMQLDSSNRRSLSVLNGCCFLCFSLDHSTTNCSTFDGSQCPVYLEWDGEVYVMKAQRVTNVGHLATFLLNKVPELQAHGDDCPTEPWTTETLLRQVSFYVSNCFVTKDPTVLFDQIPIRMGDLIVVRAVVGSPLESQLGRSPPHDKCSLRNPALYKLLREEVACMAVLQPNQSIQSNEAPQSDGAHTSSAGESSYGIRLSRVPHLGPDELNTHWADFPSDTSLHLVSPPAGLTPTTAAALSAAAEAKYSYDMLGFAGESEPSTYEQFLEQDRMREADLNDKLRTAVGRVTLLAHDADNKSEDELDRLFASFSHDDPVPQSTDENRSALKQTSTEDSNYEADYAGILNFLGTEDQQTQKANATRSSKRRDRFAFHMKNSLEKQLDRSLRPGRGVKHRPCRLDGEPLSQAQKFRDTQFGRIFRYDLFKCWVCQQGRPTRAQLDADDPLGNWLIRSSIFFELEFQVTMTVLRQMFDCIPSVTVLKVRCKEGLNTRQVFVQLFNPRQAFMVKNVFRVFFKVPVYQAKSYPKQRIQEDACFSDASCTVLKQLSQFGTGPSKQSSYPMSYAPSSVTRTLDDKSFRHQLSVFLAKELAVVSFVPAPLCSKKEYQSEKHKVDPFLTQSLILRLGELKQTWLPSCQTVNESGRKSPPTEKKWFLQNERTHREKTPKCTMTSITASLRFYSSIMKRKAAHFETCVLKVQAGVQASNLSLNVRVELQVFLIALCAIGPLDIVKTRPETLLLQLQESCLTLMQLVQQSLPQAQPSPSLVEILNNCYRAAATLSALIAANGFSNPHSLSPEDIQLGKTLARKGSCVVFVQDESLERLLKTVGDYFVWLTAITNMIVCYKKDIVFDGKAGTVLWTELHRAREEYPNEVSFGKCDAPPGGDASSRSSGSMLPLQVVCSVSLFTELQPATAVLQQTAPSLLKISQK